MFSSQNFRNSITFFANLLTALCEILTELIIHFIEEIQ